MRVVINDQNVTVIAVNQNKQYSSACLKVLIYELRMEITAFI